MNVHILNAFGTGIHIVISTILYEFYRENLIFEEPKARKNLINEAFFIEWGSKNGKSLKRPLMFFNIVISVELIGKTIRN